jgi:hypothetical protein
MPFISGLFCEKYWCYKVLTLFLLSNDMRFLTIGGPSNFASNLVTLSLKEITDCTINEPSRLGNINVI